MKYVVAVSGGVDSVVLLDMLVKEYGPASLVVAHFDHGIRAHSSDDAIFVQRLAGVYGCTYVSERVELGDEASEQLAREYRYAFLDKVTRMYPGTILATAHHLDDLVETVALQLIRGTGWRGLTPFGAPGVERPLLSLEKEDILLYAEEHGLEWREDETNTSMKYARNRIRPQVARLPLDVKRQIHALYSAQWGVRMAVRREAEQLAGREGSCGRHVIIMATPSVRRELLRYVTRGRLTRPQLDRLAIAVCVARANTVFQAGSGVKVHFTTRTFEVELIKLEKR